MAVPPQFTEVVKETEDKMSKAVEFFITELRGIRSGRATPGLLENVRAEYNGTPTPLKQIANISVPEPRVIVVRPFNVADLKTIENGIAKANLGFSVNNDGRLIRVTVPPLSEEGRQRFVGQVKDMAEKAKVSIRNIRRDSNQKAKQYEKDSKLSKDDSKRLQDKIQELVTTYEGKVAQKLEEKTKEISEI